MNFNFFTCPVAALPALQEYWLDFLHALRGLWPEAAWAAGIFLLSLLVRGLFTRFIFRLILNLSTKTKTEVDTNLLLAFESPLRTLIVAVGAYVALGRLPLDGQCILVIHQFYRSFIIIFFAWGIYNLSGGRTLDSLGKRLQFDQILIPFFSRVLRFVIIALAISIIAQEWDYDVNGFIAGLGLGGLAFALAAKDAAANLFGGVIIIMDKPFSVGDWILTPSVEGTVEEMSFRSTKVRTFANALVTVPNAELANQPITNWSRMGKRRITFHLGVTYDTPVPKLRRCVGQIREMLQNHPDIHPDTIMVYFDRFNESSLDIFLYFFTRTIVWDEYLKVKEEINLRLLELLEREGVTVALPTRRIIGDRLLII